MNTADNRKSGEGEGSTPRPLLFRCSLCGKPFLRETTTVFPFCSLRCQQIDLGQWLNEEHGLPVEGSDDMHPDVETPD
jgi:uncharacterized protein